MRMIAPGPSRLLSGVRRLGEIAKNGNSDQFSNPSSKKTGSLGQIIV